MESVIKLLLAANKVPILPHIQYVLPNNGGGLDPAVIAKFNLAIDQLVAKYTLLPAPDMYSWFQAHPDELCAPADKCGESQWDGIQPIDLPSRPGISNTIRLWAAATNAAGVYTN